MLLSPNFQVFIPSLLIKSLEIIAIPQSNSATSSVAKSS